MHEFKIESNNCLSREIQAFYHRDYHKHVSGKKSDDLLVLKNDPHHTWSDHQLNEAAGRIENILSKDLPQILQSSPLDALTVCIVPRAKADNTYRQNQLLFKTSVQKALSGLGGFDDGIDFIQRHTNTKTTHLRKPDKRYNNDGELPYPGITAETCHISGQVKGRDILLIDDIYTRTVNIDEDAIQALLDKGANSVTFYAVARTASAQYQP